MEMTATPMTPCISTTIFKQNNISVCLIHDPRGPENVTTQCCSTQTSKPYHLVEFVYFSTQYSK